MHVVLANELGLVRFLDRALHRFALGDVLTANVDVAGVRLHRERRDQAAFDQQMRIVTHDVAIFAGSWLGLVRIHNEVVRPILHLLRHEAPLQARRKARAATAAQAALLHLRYDPITPGVEHVLGAIPGAALLCALQVRAARSVEIEKDAILVSEHCRSRLNRQPCGGGCKECVGP